MPMAPIVLARRPFLALLQANLASLKPRDRLIAEYILTHAERVLASTMAEMRTTLSASNDAIIGFCHRCGLNGYADLKITLARELGQADYARLNAEPHGLAWASVIHSHRSSIIETSKLNSIAVVARASKALDNSRHIELFYGNRSFAVAYIALLRLRSVGLRVSGQFDVTAQLAAARKLHKADVALGIATPESANQIRRFLNIARKNGATTICLSSIPLPVHADIRLYSAPGSSPGFEMPFDEQITQVTFLDALVAPLTPRNSHIWPHGPVNNVHHDYETLMRDS